MSSSFIFYIHSGSRIRFEKGTGVLLRGWNVDRQESVKLYVPSSLSGDRLQNWNTGRNLTLTVEMSPQTVEIGQELEDGEEGLLNPKDYLSSEKAFVVSSCEPIGSGRRETLENIRSIDVNSFSKWATIKGTLHGEEAIVLVPASQVNRYPQIQSGAFNGWNVALSGGVLEEGGPKRVFLGFGVSFIKPCRGYSAPTC